MSNFQIDIWSFIFGAAAIQGFLLILILLFQRKGNIFSNRLLALLILIPTSVLSDRFLTHIFFYRIFPHYLFISYGLWYLWAPVLYLYIKSSLYEDVVFRTKDVLHVIFFMMYLAVNSDYIFLNGGDKIKIIDDFTGGSEVAFIYYAMPALLRIQTIVYLFFTGKLIYKYKVQESNGSKNKRVNQLYWLKFFFVSVCLLQAYDVYFVIRVFTGPYNSIFKNIRLLITVVLNYSIAFAAIKYPEYLFPQFKNGSDKYKSSKLSEKDLEKIKSALEKLMKEEKVFLNTELKLQDIAEKLSVSQHSISQTLSLRFGLNYYDYLNQFRIEEAKKILSSGDIERYTLLHVAHECGFNSKSSFNRAFKKMTGLTPSEFINSKNDVSNN